MRLQFNKYKAHKYGTPSPGDNSMSFASSSSGFSSSSSSRRTSRSGYSPFGDATPVARNAWKLDLADFSPNTAMEMQAAQIEKMAQHINDLKAAEMDLAAAEIESERRRMSDVMKNHQQAITELKQELGQTTGEVEGFWKDQVEELQGRITDVEAERDEAQNKSDEMEDQLAESAAAKEELEATVEEFRNTEQRLKQQLKLKAADLELKMREKADEISAFETKLREQEQAAAAQLAEAQATTEQCQRDLQSANASIEQLNAELATSREQAESRTREIEQQLANASELSANQNDSLVVLETKLQGEIKALKELVSSKTGTLELYDAKIASSLADRPAESQTLDELISTKANLEATAGKTKDELIRLSTTISKMQEKETKEEAEAAEFSEMVNELQNENETLKGEKELMQQQMQLTDSRVADLESALEEHNAKAQEEQAKLWGSAHETRAENQKLVKQLQSAKTDCAEAKSEQIGLQETIVSLQAKERETAAEIDALKAADKERISELTKEITELHEANSHLEGDSKQAQDVVQQCQQKLAQLAPLAFGDGQGSISSACQQLLATVEQALAAHDQALADATKEARDATMQLSVISKVNESTVSTQSTDESRKKIMQMRKALKTVEKDRDSLAEQNAMLHLDVSQLTTQLTSLLVKGSARDEEVMKLESQVKDLHRELETALTIVQVQPAPPAAAPKKIEQEEEQLSLTDSAMSTESEQPRVVPHKMRIKNDGTAKYEHMLTELRATVAETESRLADATSDKDFIREQFQGAIAQVEEMGAALEAETEAKGAMEAEVDHLRAECQLLAKDSQQLQDQLSLAQMKSDEAGMVQEQLDHLQSEMERQLSAVQDGHSQMQRKLLDEVAEANNTMSMQVWEKGVEMEQLEQRRDEAEAKLAEAQAEAQSKQERLRSEMVDQTLANNDKIIGLQSQLAEMEDNLKLEQSNVRDLHEELEEKKTMQMDASAMVVEHKQALTLAVAQNRELVEQLATADADAESDMSILHRRIVATDARNEQLERQWEELTAELKQFAGAIDSMAASENVAVQDTPKAAAMLLGMTDASGGWQAQLQCLRTKIAAIAESSGNSDASGAEQSSYVDSEVSQITGPTGGDSPSKQQLGQFIQQLTDLYKQEKQESTEMASLLKSISTKTKGTPRRTPGRRGLSERSINLAESPKADTWSKTVNSLQKKQASLAGVQDQVMQHLQTLGNWAGTNVQMEPVAVVQLRMDSSVAASPDLSIGSAIVPSTPPVAKANTELDWWTQLSETGRKHMLAAVPSGRSMGLFVDGETRWDKDMKLRILTPEKEVAPADAMIGSALEIAGLKKQLESVTKELAALKQSHANQAAEAAAAYQQVVDEADKQADAHVPHLPQPAHVLSDSTIASPASPQVSVSAVHIPQGTPDWGNLTPLKDGLFGDDQIAALSYSVNRELSVLHQRAVEINLAEQQEGTPITAPRRALSEIQEAILAHISALSNCVAEAIHEWNGEPMSPAGKGAKEKLGSLQQKAVEMSAAFQRSMGSSGAGWKNPVTQFVDEAPNAAAPVQVVCPTAVHAQEGDQVTEVPSRSLQFASAGTSYESQQSGGTSYESQQSGGTSYETQGIVSMGNLMNTPSEFANHSGYTAESDTSGDGLATGMQALPPTVAHFEQGTQATQVAMSAAMMEQRSMQTSPLGQDDAERCKALRRALIKAHEDYVNTAAAEKQVIEQLTEEIERLQKVNHTCLRRERMKDEKWSSWVRAVFTMCCDPENAGAAPMEATSAMMMAVEQFIVGHHASVKEHEGQVSLPCDPLPLPPAQAHDGEQLGVALQVVEYERNMDNMIEQKLYLTRVLSIYEEM